MDELNRILWKYEINTPNRIAHFWHNASLSRKEDMAGWSNITRPIRLLISRENMKIIIEQRILAIPRRRWPLFSGAGAIHITGRANYQAFSDYMGDERIITDGALYVGQNYYWESAGFYWSIGKPRATNDDRYDLNKKCDENASVEVITRIINGGKSKLEEREKAYAYFSEVIQ